MGRSLKNPPDSIYFSDFSDQKNPKNVACLKSQAGNPQPGSPGTFCLKPVSGLEIRNCPATKPNAEIVKEIFAENPHIYIDRELTYIVPIILTNQRLYIYDYIWGLVRIVSTFITESILINYVSIFLKVTIWYTQVGSEFGDATRETIHV